MKIKHTCLTRKEIDDVFCFPIGKRNSLLISLLVNADSCDECMKRICRRGDRLETLNETILAVFYEVVLGSSKNKERKREREIAIRILRLANQIVGLRRNEIVNRLEE